LAWLGKIEARLFGEFKVHDDHQGCQIFLDKIYQNADNITDDHKLPMPNCDEIKTPQMATNYVYQMVIKDSKNFLSKAFQNVPKLGGWF
jgi:hypothetical protein